MREDNEKSENEDDANEEGYNIVEHKFCQKAYDKFIISNGYKTQKRKKIDFADIVSHLKSKEISCRKYNYSLDKRVQNSDHYYATL